MKKNIIEFFNVRTIIFIIASLCIAAYTLVMISGYSGIKEIEQTIKNKEDGGYYILYNLLKRLGYKILHWDTYSGFRRDVLVLYFHYKKNQYKDFREIKDWVNKGNDLFLIGLYSDIDPVFNNKIMMKDNMTVEVHPSLIQGIDEFSYKTSIYFDKESKGEILLGNSQGPVLLKNGYGNGTVYLLSDGVLFTNKHLADENTAVLLNNLVKQYYGNTIFIYEPEYSGPIHPVVPFFRGKLFYLTAHLILMGFVFILCHSIRFGNPLKINPMVRRTLQHHLDAVGYFYQKSNALNLADTYDLKYFLSQIKNILGIKRKISGEELVPLLKQDYLSHYSETEISEILSETSGRSEKKLLIKRQKRNEIIEQLKK